MSSSNLMRKLYALLSVLIILFLIFVLFFFKKQFPLRKNDLQYRPGRGL